MASGKKHAKANVSLASPLMPWPLVEVPDKSGWYLKNRRNVQLMSSPSQLRWNATSVPRKRAPIRLRSRNIAGKCFTRILTRPRRMVTVCSGTSCLNATRNADCTAIPPPIPFMLKSKASNKLVDRRRHQEDAKVHTQSQAGRELQPWSDKAIPWKDSRPEQAPE